VQNCGVQKLLCTGAQEGGSKLPGLIRAFEKATTAEAKRTDIPAGAQLSSRHAGVDELCSAASVTKAAAAAAGGGGGILDGGTCGVLMNYPNQTSVVICKMRDAEIAKQDMRRNSKVVTILKQF
jgi:hypothetical protein